jgi:hypothetical protein|tara:strand:- start:132 stop:437 length:306 start_codon:yes stop_codon:yes gene_type:complete
MDATDRKLEAEAIWAEATTERPTEAELPDHKKPGSAVTLPEHYTQYKIEPVVFSMTNDLGFAQGNVVKYVLRASKKNGAEDIRKAIRYCELILEIEYGEEP